MEEENIDNPLNKKVSLGPVKIIDEKAIYIGEWKNGKRYGKGKQYWDTGSFYEGYWQDNVYNGKG